jgi:hypothetical protein
MGLTNNLNLDIDKRDGLLIISILAITAVIVAAVSSDSKHASFVSVISLLIFAILILIAYAKIINDQTEFPHFIHDIMQVEASLRFNIDYDSIGGLMRRDIDYRTLIIKCEKYHLLALNAEKNELAAKLFEKKIRFEKEFLHTPVSDNGNKNSTTAK